MQVYANSNRLSVKTILFLAAVVFIAYLPVSSFLFFLKNDAFNGYFPPKYFMSESIHAGYLPLWNPYINFGIPQYGDMSSGYWSPVTWLIASTVGYNAYSFTTELLFYVLAGGAGMYTLSSRWITDKRVRIIAAVSYMCCGYNIGHLQHFNWISGAAFLPWCIWAYTILLNKFSFRNVLITALLFYLLIASAHPGITISACYLFMAILLYHFFVNRYKESVAVRIKNICRTHFILLPVLLLISAGMITGYLDILPHFVRGEKISLADSLSNPTNFQSWLSALLPFTTVKNDAFFNTDPSMRNSYFGISLLIFFLTALLHKRNSWQNFLLLTGFAFMLLASGGFVKTIAYETLPLIGYIRLNGEFRIFTILCLIITAAIALEKFILQKNTFSGKIKWVYYIIELLLFAFIIGGFYKARSHSESFIFSLGDIIAQDGYALKLKAFIDAVSFYDTLWLQASIQLLFLWGIKYCIRAADWNLLKKLTVANMVILSLMNIPYTGTGKASVAQVQDILDKAATGIPVPPLQPILMNDTLTTREKELVGNWSMYNKQIGIKEEVPYPVSLKNMKAYFEDNSPGASGHFPDKAFLFIPANNNAGIHINQFSPNRINVSAYVNSPSFIFLQQNHYPHWYYYNGAEKKEVQKAGINFMCAPVAKGENNISFSFEPKLIKWMMLLSISSFAVALLMIFVLGKKADVE